MEERDKDIERERGKGERKQRKWERRAWDGQSERGKSGVAVCGHGSTHAPVMQHSAFPRVHPAVKAETRKEKRKP